MKNLKNIQKAILGAALLLPMGLAAQQASVSIQGLSGTGIAITAGTVYLPGGSYLNSTGNIYFATNQFVADSANTIITGGASNRLHILGANQTDASVTAAPTLIDANGTNFNVNVSSYNPLNLALTDQAFGAVALNANANTTVNNEFIFESANPFNASVITDNHVVTNNNKFNVGALGTLTGFDANRYVVTNDNAGELRKLGLNANDAFLYPIGRAEADYTPARLQVASGGPVDYYMNVRNFAESTPDENIGGYATMPNVSRTWTVYGSNSNTTANMDFIHPGTPMYEVNGYDRTNSNVVRFANNSWIPNLPNDAENESLFGTPANYFAQQISFAVPSMLGDNSYFGKSNSLIVLPIKLESFTAVAADCNAVLNWATSFEQNSSHFTIERMYDGTNQWVAIGRVNASVNSSVLKQYSFIDTRANAVAASYRLVLVDKDGGSKRSDVRWVRFNCGASQNISIYPNPAHDYVNVLLPQGTMKYNIRVTNMAGQTVLPVITSANNTAMLLTGKLPNGTYIITVTDANGKNSSTRIIKN